MAVDISNYVANAPPSGVKSNTAAGSSDQQNMEAGLGNLTTSYSTFLKLLTAQLQNQDPTSPLDPNQFTAQIVQMTGVQQQLLTNNLLTQMVTNAQTTNGYGAVSLIGKTVEAEGNAAELQGGQARWSYDLSEAASSAQLSIANSSGQVVWSGAASGLGDGINEFNWDGKDTNGQQVPDGVYKLTVAAKDADNKAIASTTYVRGLVTAIEQVDGESLVAMGKAKVPLSSVLKVSA